MYAYGMRLRPAGPGCQPNGFCKIVEGTSGYHNVLYYERPLTKDELSHYSLDDLNAVSVELTESDIVSKYENGEISYDEACKLLEGVM